MNSALVSALSHFEQKRGELYVGGRSITSIVADFGSPIYIYDRSILERKCEALRAAIPKDIQVYYAVKANPNMDIIRKMAENCDGFDISSQGEMERVVEAGLPPELMSFAGPGKTVSELYFAIENDIGVISVESEQEIEHIKRICKRLKKKVHITIRVNPPFDLASSGMKMGGGPKPFGIDSERVPMVIERIRNDDSIQFSGIHVFLGSQNLSADILLNTFDKIFQYCGDISLHVNMPLKIVNLGGGLGIPYFNKDKELDIQFLGKGLKNLLDKYREQLPETVFRIELGRFLVGECGIYVCSVLYRKTSRTQVFLITNGGMHHHLAASGNLGQSLVRRPMPITIANKLDKEKERVTVVGPLCTPLDSFGTVDVPQAEEDDLVVVFNSGAYGFSASPLFFLGHKFPKEIVI